MNIHKFSRCLLIVCILAAANSAFPASKNIAYVVKNGTSDNIVIYDVETKKTRNATNLQDAGDITSISANRAGDSIVFTRPSPSNGRNNSGIWSVNPDGSSFSDMIEGEANLDFKYAAISPDGTKLAFSRNSLASPGTYHLYIKTPTETRLLTSAIGYPAECAYPLFIDDNRILFLVIDLTHGRYDLYTVNADSTSLTNLTNNNDNSPYFPRLGRPSMDASATSVIYGKQIQDASGFSEWRIYTLNLNTGLELPAFGNLYYGTIDPESQPDPQPFFRNGGDVGLIGTTDGIVFDLYFTRIDAANPYMDRATSSVFPSLPYYFTTQDLPGQWIFENNGQLKLRDMYGNESNLGSGRNPAFNPSGTMAVYANGGLRLRRLGSVSSVLMDADTTSDFPAFSSDGKWIAYARNNDIWARLIDMSNSPRQLTNSPLVSESDISFSPDGKHLLYTGTENGRKYVYLMPLSITYGAAPLINSAGLPSRLTYQTYDNYNPSFSPCGTKISFVSTRNQVAELWIMNADGTGQGKIIFAPPSPVNPAFPRFSPFDSDILAYAGGNLRIYKVDLSADFKTGYEHDPLIITTGSYSWGKAPSENIETVRQMSFDTCYPDIPLRYRISVSINKKQLPASFLLEETVPSSWNLSDVKINGEAPTNTSISVSGDRKTARWLFGGGGMEVTDSLVELSFDITGETIGNKRWLTGGATVSDRKYLTCGNSQVTIGEPFIPVDEDRNWQIEDLELLDAIDLWAKNGQLNGWPTDMEDWDFWLLKIINYWAGNNGYRYKAGGIQPDWEAVP